MQPLCVPAAQKLIKFWIQFYATIHTSAARTFNKAFCSGFAKLNEQSCRADHRSEHNQCVKQFHCVATVASVHFTRATEFELSIDTTLLRCSACQRTRILVLIFYRTTASGNGAGACERRNSLKKLFFFALIFWLRYRRLPFRVTIFKQVGVTGSLLLLLLSPPRPNWLKKPAPCDTMLSTRHSSGW